jgi:hypothetical protein
VNIVPEASVSLKLVNYYWVRTKVALRIRKNQLLVSAAKGQHWSRICFSTFILQKFTESANHPTTRETGETNNGRFGIFRIKQKIFQTIKLFLNRPLIFSYNEAIYRMVHPHSPILLS